MVTFTFLLAVTLTGKSVGELLPLCFNRNCVGIGNRSFN